MTNPLNILVVDDELAIRGMLRTTLIAKGYEVVEADSFRQGMVLAQNRRIDVFLIDLGLPDGDGVRLIEAIRSWTTRPILVLSARSQETQKVEALDAGADDFLVKPFGVEELHARIRVALRLASRLSGPSEQVMLGGWKVDLVARSVEREGERLRLSATQWRLLEVLVKNAGRVVTSKQLLREVWGPGHAEQGHYLRIYVRQLRQKLEVDPTSPVHLLTETGVGYRLIPASSST